MYYRIELFKKNLPTQGGIAADDKQLMHYDSLLLICRAYTEASLNTRLGRHRQLISIEYLSQC